MIQQSHLTAWQAFAPWDKRSKIEQDLRLTRGIAALFADEILSKHLAMRGGTVLHKGHLAPAARYSEDIDLVLVKRMDREVLDARLRKILAPVLGEPSDSVIRDAWLVVRNVLKPSKILRTVYSYVPLGLKFPMTIKVEVNLNENASLFPLVPVEVDLLDDEGEVRRCSVQSYQINEMLGTKLRALMQRTQGRDLFDLYHAGNLGAKGATQYVIKEAEAIEAFTWYLANEGARMDREEADRLLSERVRNAAFRRDMNTLLRADCTPYDIDAAAALVRDTYFVHLRKGG